MALIQNNEYIYGHTYDEDYRDGNIVMKKSDRYRYLVSPDFYLDQIYVDLIEQNLRVSAKYHPMNGYKVGIGSKKVNNKLINLIDPKTGLYPEIMGEHNIIKHEINIVTVYKYKNLLIKLDDIKYTEKGELKYKFKNITNNDTNKTGLVYHTESNSFLSAHSRIICSLYVKVLDYEESSNLFGFKPTKKEMVGRYYKIDNIDYNQICKKDNIERSVVELQNTNLGKNLKFVLSDLEVQIPDLTEFLKGYNPPKDRKIREGLNVRVVNNKLTRLNIGDKLKVIYIHKENIPTVYNKCKHKHTLIQCVNEQGKQFSLKLKQVKVI